MRCNICGEEHPDDAQICPNTGEQLKKMCLNQDCSYYHERIFELDIDTCPCCGEELFITSHEYVDLGLSVKWAKHNLGWNVGPLPSFYGWGSLVPNRPNSRKKVNNCETGHCHLQPDEDVATKEWGDDWRIPTKSEWEELISSSDLEWVDLGGNAFGAKLTSRINGKSIILPAEGLIVQIFGKLCQAGKSACYWSSSYRPSSTDDYPDPYMAEFSRSKYPAVDTPSDEDERAHFFNFLCLIRPVFGKSSSDAL